MNKILLLLLCVFMVTGCQSTHSRPFKFDTRPGTRVAFLADIHFHNIYPQDAGEGFEGLPTQTPDGEQKARISSMASQLESDHLANETYFALHAALDDIVRRGIKLVALPGNFSADQLEHKQELVTLLRQYRDRHDIRFFLIPEHKPSNNKPSNNKLSNNSDADKTDQTHFSHTAKLGFLAANGSVVTKSETSSNAITNIDKRSELSAENRHKLADNVANGLAEFGLLPHPTDLFHETPATWCELNKSATCKTAPDNSFLVEPVPGVWILAIDANVMLPGDDNVPFGHNAVLQYKPHLLGWIANVVKRAKAQGKELVAFSQFPVTDVYNGATAKMEQLFGKHNGFTRGAPFPETAQALADTGLQLHVGAGMGMNSTSVMKGLSKELSKEPGEALGKDANSKALFNVQVPSLAGYRPAYKLLTLNKSTVFVQTKLLENVPRFNELFGHYRNEHAYGTAHTPNLIWDSAILNAQHYGELTEKHLLTYVRQQQLPNNWPVELREMLSYGSIGNLIDKLIPVCKQSLTQAGFEDVNLHLAKSGFFNPIAPLSAMTLVDDFNRLRQAGSVSHIDGVRKNCYAELSKGLQQCNFDTGSNAHKLSLMMAIMKDLITAEPNKDIRLNLNTGKVHIMSISRKRVPLNPYFMDLEAQPAAQLSD